MRILFYNHAPELGGAERSLLAIMERAQQASHEILFCAPSGDLLNEASRMKIRGRPMPRFEVGYTRNPFTLVRYASRVAAPVRALVQKAREFQPQLIHANTPRSGMVAAQALLFLRPRPALVVHARDGLEHGRSDWLVSQAIGSQADTIIAISHYVAETLRVPRRKVRVLHNAIDLASYTFDRTKGQALRQLLGIPSGAPLLLVAGQISPWKGQMDALDALSIVRQQLPSAHLLLAGSVKFTGKHRRYDNDAYFRELVVRSQASDLAGHAHLVKELPDASALYSAANVLLVPSRAEPFGRVVIEAMSACCPVIGTVAGGIPEIIHHGENGWLVPPHNPSALAGAALEIVRNPGLAQRLVRSGSQRVAGNFSLDAYMEQLQAIWRASLCDSALSFPEESEWQWQGQQEVPYYPADGASRVPYVGLSLPLHGKEGADYI